MSCSASDVCGGKLEELGAMPRRKGNLKMKWMSQAGKKVKAKGVVTLSSLCVCVCQQAAGKADELDCPECLMTRESSVLLFFQYTSINISIP